MGERRLYLANGDYVLLADGERRTGRSDLREEVGATGTQFFPGLLKNDEFNSKLQGKTGAETYNKMRRTDAQVRATLNVLKLPIRAATWSVEAEDPDVEAFLQENLFDRIDFDGYLRHALLMLDFGFELLEKVYDLDGGRIVLKKLAHRAQTTVHEWHVDENGDLTAVTQQVWKDRKYQTVTIPADKLAHFVFDQEGNNFEGTAILRSAYKHWYIKDGIYRIDAIAHERFGVGVPMMEAPENYSKDDKLAAETMMKNYKAGEKAWFFLPPGWKASVLGASDATRYDPMPSIKHHDEMISRNILAQFLNFGTTETGARALGESAQEMFMFGLQATANQIAAVTNRQVIRPLLRLNFPNGDGLQASLRWADLETRNVEMLSRALAALSAGGFVTPDEDLEEHLRDVMDMPQKAGQVSKTASEHRHRRAVRLADGAYWRPLTDAEKSMALGEISGRQDDAEENLVEIWRTVRQSWIDSLVDQIKTALSDNDPSDVGEVAVPPDLKFRTAGAIVALARDLFGYGRRTVREEMARQQRRAKIESQAMRDEPPEDKEIRSLFWVRSRQLLNRLSSRVESIAQEKALGLYRTKAQGWDDEDFAAMNRDLVGMFENTVKLEARAVVSEAVNLGRNREMENLRDEIERTYYSAILDENLCEVCEEADGQEVEIGSEEYYDLAPPNRNCLSTQGGANRCRCVYVSVFKTEQASRG